MQRCGACGQDKPEEEFNKRTPTRLQWACKACQRVNHRKHYLANKQAYLDQARRHRERMYALVVAHKMQPCADCGGEFPPICMDFHHAAGEKVDDVGHLGRYASEEMVLEEIAKCDVVCSNCHRLRSMVYLEVGLRETIQDATLLSVRQMVACLASSIGIRVRDF